MSTFYYEQRPADVAIGQICDHPFPVHVHDEVEIVCALSGRQELTIANKHYVLLPGDIAVIFPTIPHGYDLVSSDATGVALIFSPDTIAEFAWQFRSKTLTYPLVRSHQKPPELEAIINGLQERFFLQQANHPLKLGFLHLFLAFLFTVIQPVPMEKQMHFDLSCQVLHYIGEHYLEPITLETVARALGVSRIHLSHIFSQQLRINFRQYINALRIDRACFLLRDPACAISEISYLCGYGNPRTFHRAFFSQRQMTPTQYREQHIENRDAVEAAAESKCVP